MPLNDQDPHLRNGNTHNLLAEQNQQLDVEVKATLHDKIERLRSVELPGYGDYVSVATEEDIKAAVADLGYDTNLIKIGPPTKKNDLTKDIDLAFNTIQLARMINRNPAELAAEIVGSLAHHDMIANIQASGSYVNIELEAAEYSGAVIEEVAKGAEYYGHFRDGDPQVIVIDYSSPNVAKSMTVAHLRSTVIGLSLMKIHQAAGNIPFGINHIGDWGTQFGNIIYQYQKEMAENPQALQEELASNPNATIMRLYREFNKHSDDYPDSVEAGRDLFLRLEQGDPEMVELWAKFRQWSLEEFFPIYRGLGVTFDAIQGESFYEDKMMPAVEDALQKGVLVYKKLNEENEDEQPAVVFPGQPLTDPTTMNTYEAIMRKQDGQPKDEIILKPNGGTVYLTRDLAALRYRYEELGADRILYVIGKEQINHCMELFAMGSQLGYGPLGSAEHIWFGHLNQNNRKMSTRKGEIVLLDELLQTALDAAVSVMMKRKEDQGEVPILTDEETEVARKIAFGAIIYNDLKNFREKDIEFDSSTVRSLEAGNATYVQYTHARLNAVLEKVGTPEPLTEIPGLSDIEKSIVGNIARFPQVVKEAAERNAPHVISAYLTELCGNINVFYHNHRINESPELEKNFRLNLVAAARQVIINASDFLHLELPEVM